MAALPLTEDGSMCLVLADPFPLDGGLDRLQPQHLPAACPSPAPQMGPPWDPPQVACLVFSSQPTLTLQGWLGKPAKHLGRPSTYVYVQHPSTST